ncbi:MAG: M15 family metallopeptidase [Acutalibacteraceae bacterium]|nr:M15 family metallopeptidase [Acutalibacteraceae bacterium]
MTKSQRQKAIIRRRIFLSVCAVILVAVTVLIAFAVKAVISGGAEDSTSSQTSSTPVDSVADVSSEESSVPSYPETVPNGLDATYSNFLLVNGENPLPDDYDYEGNLTTIPDEYINGSLKQIDKNVWPYMKAMIDAAWADGVKLYVWSPYRSYSTQNMLFQNQVNRCIQKGTPTDKAEEEAATVVARPGTSEHHTGLAADFNMADDKFETTEMYAWMQQHAADYGFIMRYSGEKQAITGVIHESWHYRFVGINTAKEMNRLDMCLEEYVEYLNKQ